MRKATHRIREPFERSTYGLHFEEILSFILLEVKNKRELYVLNTGASTKTYTLTIFTF